MGKEPGKLVLVDAPGYGARGKREWGELFDGYLETRKECAYPLSLSPSLPFHNPTNPHPLRLKRIYILFNAKHGLNPSDTQMLTHLSTFLLSPTTGTQPFTLQSVITKLDLLPQGQLQSVIGKMKKEIFEAAPLCLPPILTSCEMNPAYGVEKVRKSIAEACGWA